MPDVHSKEIRSYNMSRIKSKNTKIELLLAKELWGRGVRYRKNDKTIYGKPDFSLKGIKLAIFCDSEFWHGKDIDSIEKRIDTNKDFWISKIQRNIARDVKVNEKLTIDGWLVLRYWEKDIKRNIQLIADDIIEKIKKLKVNNN
ncbi:very short patch repair endonuclease [Mucilaginibacter sp.]|uniref:very short patch repair endonuclease n=1 Tax=Mucilaginibacter sp. TaxID=1882438 RepID=UPI0025D7340D|nr:very short patch repair endonuclease [Mucilaginibacter sp.]